MDFQQSLRDLTRRDWEHDDGPDEPVRFALIGLGWFTRELVVPAIERSDYCEATVLVSGSGEKAEEVRAEAGGERALTYEQFHDGEAADAYDAAYVVTPNALHAEYVETAADLGKAVLCEKPIAASVEGAERIVEACDEADVPLMIAYRMQTNPLVRRARELIVAGAIGEPVLVEGGMCQDVFDVISPDPDQWRLDADLSGGAALADLGLYPLNTARFVLDADPVEVSGTTASQHEAFDDVDEHVTFEVSYDDGTRGSFYASQRADLTSRFAVIGRTGRIELEDAFFGEPTLRVDGEDVSAELSADSVDGVGELTEEFDFFADRLRAGEPFPADGEHGLLDMRAIEAIYRSAEEGQSVSLER